MTKTYVKIDYWGNIIWKTKCGRWHREDDKPAIIWPDGTVWFCWLGTRYEPKVNK